MVGIGHGRLGNVPRRVPAQIVIVEQTPHEFCHRQSRMGVVELNGNFVGEGVKAIVGRQIGSNHVLYGTRHQKIFLNKP